MFKHFICHCSFINIWKNSFTFSRFAYINIIKNNYEETVSNIMRLNCFFVYQVFCQTFLSWNTLEFCTQVVFKWWIFIINLQTTIKLNIFLILYFEFIVLSLTTLFSLMISGFVLAGLFQWRSLGASNFSRVFSCLWNFTIGTKYQIKPKPQMTFQKN